MLLNIDEEYQFCWCDGKMLGVQCDWGHSAPIKHALAYFFIYQAFKDARLTTILFTVVD
jgi:hypothetical protein